MIVFELKLHVFKMARRLSIPHCMALCQLSPYVYSISVYWCQLAK